MEFLRRRGKVIYFGPNVDIPKVVKQENFSSNKIINQASITRQLNNTGPSPKQQSKPRKDRAKLTLS